MQQEINRVEYMIEAQLINNIAPIKSKHTGKNIMNNSNRRLQLGLSITSPSTWAIQVAEPHIACRLREFCNLIASRQLILLRLGGEQNKPQPVWVQCRQKGCACRSWSCNTPHIRSWACNHYLHFIAVVAADRIRLVQAKKMQVEIARIERGGYSTILVVWQLNPCEKDQDCERQHASD